MKFRILIGAIIALLAIYLFSQPTRKTVHNDSVEIIAATEQSEINLKSSKGLKPPETARSFPLTGIL